MTLTIDLCKLILAAFCGALIGAERELKHKPAGIRTCALVAFGSALFTLLGTFIAGQNVDHGRLAASVIQGVGFLGAGTILVHKEQIIGLTTSAMVWVVCAIGVSFGFSQIWLGILSTLLVLALIAGISYFETKFGIAEILIKNQKQTD